MTQIFRTASKEAIREIIADNAQESRFGYLVTEMQLEAICERVVDLFETAINLRTGMQERLGPALAALKNPPAPQQDERFEPGGGSGRFPRVKAAADIYVEQERAPSLPEPSAPAYPAITPGLPRKRIAMTETERTRLSRHRG